MSSSKLEQVCKTITDYINRLGNDEGIRSVMEFPERLIKPTVDIRVIYNGYHIVERFNMHRPYEGNENQIAKYLMVDVFRDYLEAKAIKIGEIGSE